MTQSNLDDIVDDQRGTVDSDDDRRETHSGRPPVGYEVVAGQLEKADNYKTVCKALNEVTLGIISIRQAARDAGCSRRTIKRAVNLRSEMYGLPEDEQI